MLKNIKFLPPSVKVSTVLLEQLEIDNFTYKEIKDTDATPEDVNINTIIALNDFRAILDIPVYLVFNGMTTGMHKSPTHPDGLASDVYILPKDMEMTRDNFKRCYYAALDSGFRGIGSYYNKETDISGFHLDIGETIRRWKAIKLKKGFNWIYSEFDFNHKIKLL